MNVSKLYVRITLSVGTRWAPTPVSVKLDSQTPLTVAVSIIKINAFLLNHSVVHRQSTLS